MRVKAHVPKKECLLGLVGEAPGEQEAKYGIPFVDTAPSGKFLTETLEHFGFNREDNCLITNPFSVRPPENKILYFFRAATNTPMSYKNTSSFRNKYLKPEYFKEIIRLQMELLKYCPKIIIALGAVALWALTGKEKITEWRGKFIYSSLVDRDIFPTFHPMAIKRNPDWTEDWLEDWNTIRREIEQKNYNRYPMMNNYGLAG